MRQLAVLLLLVGLCSCDETRAPKVARAQEKPKSASDVGRYVIVHSPHIQRDTMLLDTVTGQTWQMVQFSDLKGEPVAWQRVTKLDTAEDYQVFFKTYASKLK
jgi:hypothetical protein